LQNGYGIIELTLDLTGLDKLIFVKILVYFLTVFLRQMGGSKYFENPKYEYRQS